MKHTPGPWQKIPSHRGSFDIYAGEIWLGVAHGSHDLDDGQGPGKNFPSNKQADANAQLISQAPDLLAMVKKSLSFLMSEDDPTGLEVDMFRAELEDTIAAAESSLPA